MLYTPCAVIERRVARFSVMRVNQQGARTHRNARRCWPRLLFPMRVRVRAFSPTHAHTHIVGKSTRRMRSIVYFYYYVHVLGTYYAQCSVYTYTYDTYCWANMQWTRNR